MDPITGLAMLVSSIGIQFFTNNANNNKSEEIAEKQRKFRDLLDRQRIEHSQELQTELNRLQVELERAVHEMRIQEIENSHDDIIKKLVEDSNVDSWPLNVLPFVIKGRSFGTMLGGGAKTISVHCFLTPSNNSDFNRFVYTDLDVKMEADINENWSTRSTHPVYYYGGAWRDKNSDINHTLVCVEQMESNLRSMPCIVITPYFLKNGIEFRIKLWGMGAESSSQKLFFINTNDDLSVESIKFSYQYYFDMKFGDNDLISTTIDEFSIYLQSLIGFITDKYFWSMYGLSPALPTLLAQNRINTNGQKWIIDGIKRLYFQTIQDCFDYKKVESSLIDSKKLSSLYLSSLPLWNNTSELIGVNDIVNQYSSHQPVDVQFIETESNLIDVIEGLVEKKSSEYKETDFFNFVFWNDDIVVGSFCTKEGRISTSFSYNKTIYVFYNSANYSANPLLNVKCYQINKKNIMETKTDFTQQESSSFRERLGDILIKHGNELKAAGKKNSPVSSVWGNEEHNPKPSNYKLEDLERYFISSIDDGSIEAVAVTTDMSLSIILEWLSDLNQDDVNASKLYILQSYVKVKERKHFLYSAFLGNERTMFLQHKELIKCFVCNHESDEMRELFAGNRIYIVPFEK